MIDRFLPADCYVTQHVSRFTLLRYHSTVTLFARFRG